MLSAIKNFPNIPVRSLLLSLLALLSTKVQILTLSVIKTVPNLQVLSSLALLVQEYKYSRSCWNKSTNTDAAQRHYKLAQRAAREYDSDLLQENAYVC
jgi:hypothetical protein